MVVRFGAERARTALGEPHVRRFDITGRPMKGWVLVDHEGMENDEQFESWINEAITFVSTLPAK